MHSAHMAYDKIMKTNKQSDCHSLTVVNMRFRGIPKCKCKLESRLLSPPFKLYYRFHLVIEQISIHSIWLFVMLCCVCVSECSRVCVYVQDSFNSSYFTISLILSYRSKQKYSISVKSRFYMQYVINTIPLVLL